MDAMMIRIVLVLTVLAVFPTRGIGFEGPPPSLGTLVKHSDHIVVAKVVSVFPDTSGFSSIARLRVSSYVKGRRKTNQIDVVFYPSMLCPAPARFKEGERVLAFIKNRKGKFLVPFDHDGTKVLPDEELAALVEKIRGMLPAPNSIRSPSIHNGG